MGGEFYIYGEKRDAYRVLVGKPERNHLKEQGTDERIILKWLLRTQDKRSLYKFGLGLEHVRAVVNEVINLRILENSRYF